MGIRVREFPFTVSGIASYTPVFRTGEYKSLEIYIEVKSSEDITLAEFIFESSPNDEGTWISHEEEDNSIDDFTNVELMNLPKIKYAKTEEIGTYGRVKITATTIVETAELRGSIHIVLKN